MSMNIQRFIRPLVLAMLLTFSAAAFAGVFFSVSVGPPPIPVYTQPLVPGPGYIWTPGYWAWSDAGYYWVPGTWVQPPEVGLLWTPGYWGWNNGLYAWNQGYWGPQVGFYGGINYGFGYTGVGYEGGYWRGRDFYYNRSVNNVNVTNIRNVYNKTVVNNNRTRVSYNGGTGGVHAQPTAQQLQARNQHHIQPTPMQQQHLQQAARNPQLLARNNNGKPPIAATARPADFKSAVPAKAPGGRVNRAALTANAKTAAPRANATGASRPNRAGTPTARGGANVPKPPTATARTRTNPSGTTARNVPEPPKAAPSRTRPETNARVNAPPARTTSPAAPTRPSTSASSRPERTSPGSRSMGMPQSEGAPRNPAPRSHATSRPSGPSARESAPPKGTNSHAPQHSQASQAAAAKHHESPSHPEDKKPH